MNGSGGFMGIGALANMAKTASTEKSKVMSFYNGFKDVLDKIISVHTGELESLDMDGFILNQENKDGVAATMAVETYTSDGTSTFNQMMDMLMVEKTLEDQLNKFIG